MKAAVARLGTKVTVGVLAVLAFGVGLAPAASAATVAVPQMARNCGQMLTTVHQWMDAYIFAVGYWGEDSQQANHAWDGAQTAAGLADAAGCI